MIKNIFVFFFSNKLVSNDQLRGQTLSDKSEIFQWIEYGEREITPVSTTLVYPCMGILQFNKNHNEHAKGELKNILQLLDNYLRTRTYLVGERMTLADITIACDLLLLFQWVRKLKNKLFFNMKLIFRLLNQVYVKHIKM